MRIGFKHYWKTDRKLFIPILAFGISKSRFEFVVLGVGFILWKV